MPAPLSTWLHSPNRYACGSRRFFSLDPRELLLVATLAELLAAQSIHWLALQQQQQQGQASPADPPLLPLRLISDVDLQEAFLLAHPMSHFLAGGE